MAGTKKKKVLLIAGHGRNHDGSYDPGACSRWGKEADYTREWVNKLKTALGKAVAVTIYDVDKNCYSESKAGNVPDYAAYDFVYEAHMNAKTKKDETGDGSFTGTGGYKHPDNRCTPLAQAIVDNIVRIGFRKWMVADSTGLLNLNRCQSAGVLYFLHEIAFIDDGDDMEFYTANIGRMVQATAQAILDVLAGNGTAVIPEEEKEIYRVRRVWGDGFNGDNQIFAGTKEGAVAACKVGYSVFDKDGNAVYTKAAGIQAENLKNLVEEEWIERVAPLYTADEEAHGILACVSLAQAILESGYGKTDLAQIGNNLHGMKTRLSGNTWPGTSWDGSSTYTKPSPEVINGKTVMKTSRFRCYDCIEDSIHDHAMYLLGAANGTRQRYAGLQGERDYKKAITVIWENGYATDDKYVEKICSIIDKHKLTRFNAGSCAGGADVEGKDQGSPYTVKITADLLNIRSGPGTSYLINGTTERGKSHIIVEEKNGWGCLKDGLGWICLKYTDNGSDGSSGDGIYTVKVTADILNIRSGPGISYRAVGKIKDKGIYSIQEQKNGWGRLKSGLGWICLRYTKKN